MHTICKPKIKTSIKKKIIITLHTNRRIYIYKLQSINVYLQRVGVASVCRVGKSGFVVRVLYKYTQIH